MVYVEIKGLITMKKILVLNLIFLLVMLTGCNFNNSDETDELDLHTSERKEESEYCREILDEVIRCLDEDDSEALKEMFSEHCKSKCDLDSDIEEAFDFYQGKLVSLEEYTYGRASCSVEYGYFSYKSGEPEYMKVTTTENEEYKIRVDVVLVDDNDTSNIGVRCINIINKKSSEMFVVIGGFS